MTTGYKLTSTREDYMTPKQIIDNILYIEGVEKFDLDVCCNETNIPAHEYYRAEVDIETGQVTNIINDGLLLPWKNLNWCNPPFSKSIKWIKKAMKEQQEGHSTWLILPFRPECAYWDDILCQQGQWNGRILENDRIHLELLRKGLCFVDPITRSYAGVFKNPLALLKLKGYYL